MNQLVMKETTENLSFHKSADYSVWPVYIDNTVQVFLIKSLYTKFGLWLHVFALASVT